MVRNQRKLGILLFLLAASLVPTSALCGLKIAEPVSVTTLSNGDVRLRGSLIGAHYSEDNLQYIGCQNRHDFSYCWGRDSQNRSFMCSTSGAGHMAAMRSVNAASHVDVIATAGSCKSIEITTASQRVAKLQTMVVSP